MIHFNYELICDFNNLYHAYLASRRSKRTTREVIQFEMNVGPNLCQLQQELRDGSYQLSGYYHFAIHDPKVREIYALHYRDRILQHCLCDNLLASYFERHLIYDNAACRTGKGTLLAVNRLNHFLLEQNGTRAGEPFVKKIDEKEDIWELRPLGNRILFVAYMNNTFVLLHVFQKKTQKTPTKQIEQARREVKDLKERGIEEDE